VRLLVDTHTLIWALADPDQLSTTAEEAIKSEASDVFVSIISPWEIAIKKSLGKLRAPDDLGPQLAAKRFEILPISLPHIEALETLPYHHRDPFDRLLVAQAQVERLSIVTADSQFEDYDVSTIWE
jgi:PIN domain nuclease of toxin-antitoxin system